MPLSLTKLLSGFLLAVLYQHSTLFLSTIRTKDLHGYLTLYNFLIFVLNPLLIKSSIGEPESLAEILKLIQRTWDISLPQILFIRSSTVKEWILFQLSLLLKMSSSWMSIVRITFYPKQIPRDALPIRICSSSNIKHVTLQSRNSLSAITQPKVRFSVKKSKVL